MWSTAGRKFGREKREVSVFNWESNRTISDLGAGCHAAMTESCGIGVPAAYLNIYVKGSLVEKKRMLAAGIGIPAGLVHLYVVA